MIPICFLFALYRQQLVSQFADSYSFLLCFVVLCYIYMYCYIYVLLSPSFYLPFPYMLIITFTSLFVVLAPSSSNGSKTNIILYVYDINYMSAVLQFLCTLSLSHKFSIYFNLTCLSFHHISCGIYTYM